MTRALAFLAALAFLRVAPAVAADPPVPAGQDPGGTAVALFTAGIDYTLPEVARVLARDGEGELIGWDFVDNERQPFAVSDGKAPSHPSDDGTALLKLFLGSKARIIPVRVDLADPLSLARAAAFVAKTPARVVIIPISSGQQQDWEPFRQVAVNLKDIVFVATVSSDGNAPVYPEALGLNNLIALTARTCGLHEEREPVALVLARLCQSQAR